MSVLIRPLARSAVLVGAGLALSVANAPAFAAAPAPSTLVSSTSATGLVIRGSAATTITQVQLSNGYFYIFDSGPVVPGVGCEQVAGDPKRAACQAYGGATRQFHLAADDGNDTVFNFTAVGMIADGGAGNDTLHGSVTAGDDLSGSIGNDKLVGNGGPDRFVGGLGNDTQVGGYGDDLFVAGDGAGGLDGADVMDGGPGLADRVDYTSYRNVQGARLFVDLSSNNASDGALRGTVSEGDNVMDTVEQLHGSPVLSNSLFGNDRDNVLMGGAGDDLIVGFRGADRMSGGAGNDSLFSHSTFGGLNADGAVDLLGGGAGTDACSVAAQDGDRSVECESAAPP